MLVPKLATTLKTYDRHQFRDDLIAGTIVGIVALPLAIAFAIASGVSPDRGIWTAIIAGFIISALGGSRVQIGGPTGAFVVIVAGIVAQHGMPGLLAATMMAGVMLIIMGVAGLGTMIKFIPRPLITGFTSGIAVVILWTQVKGFRQTGDELLVAGVSLVILLLWPRISRRIPSPVVALVACTLLAGLFALDVETIGSRFGAIQLGVPKPALPSMSWAELRLLISPAFTIAILAAIESLLSAVVADGMIGARHRSNMELVAQGIANIASPLFGGLPATGAIARTATNVKNGGRTPIAGITHALVLLLIALFFWRWIARIPLASLAGILVLVAYHMSEWRTFVAELRSPKSDIAVMLTTFLLTVFVDLTVAIEIGMILAAFLFIRRMAEVTNVRALTGEWAMADDAEDPYVSDATAVGRRRLPKGVEVYEINGPLFFGAAERFRETLGRVSRRPKVLIIRMRNVMMLDSTGMHVLREVVVRTRKEGTVVLLSDVHMQPLAALTGTVTMSAIGAENMFENLEDALHRAREVLGLPREAPVEPPSVTTDSPRAGSV